MVEDIPKKKRAGSPNPMDEENFPTNNPTRRAVERDMKEPSNVRGPSDPTPHKKPPIQEAGDE